MATRIFVQCKSHEMPGLDKEKNRNMANKACQKVWSRDFDHREGDRLATFGGYFLYNQRCWLIVDHGPVDSTEYTLLPYKWNFQKQELELICEPLHPYILKEFREKYHFDPAQRPKLDGYSDEEYGEKFGTEKLNELRNARQEKLEIAKRFSVSHTAP